jgi:hypothetical protein
MTLDLLVVVMGKNKVREMVIHKTLQEFQMLSVSLQIETFFCNPAFAPDVNA